MSLDTTRLKKEIKEDGSQRFCLPFQKGECKRGDLCKFAHVLGSVSNFKGACFAFERTGSCEKGDACKFSHDMKVIPVVIGENNNDNAAKASLPLTAPKVIRVCYSFKDTGACDKGDACEFAHIINVKKKRARVVMESGSAGSTESDGSKKQKTEEGEEGENDELKLKQAKLSKKERNKRAAIVRARGYKPNNYKERSS